MSNDTRNEGLLRWLISHGVNEGKVYEQSKPK